MESGDQSKTTRNESGTQIGRSDSLFDLELERSLTKIKMEFKGRDELNPHAEDREGWELATEMVLKFKPVPWFVWRISNFVFCKQGHSKELNDGFIFGMRKLVCTAAMDPFFGGANNTTLSTRDAVKILSPDVVGAVAIIHSICRKLKGKANARIWESMLDDAILRAKIGCIVGDTIPDFGSGRGMLAGFSSRSGFVLSVAMGNEQQAKSALDQLAFGKSPREVGVNVYKCDPFQVSSMLLLASGCGRDAAIGTAGFFANTATGANGVIGAETAEERKGHAAFSVCESIRRQEEGKISESDWEVLGLTNEFKREILVEDAKEIVRRGHQWNWLVGWDDNE